MSRCRRSSGAAEVDVVRRRGAWTGLGGAGVRDFFATSGAMVAVRPGRRVAPTVRVWDDLRSPADAGAEGREEDRMGWLDKLLGRGKKAAGDMTGDSSLRREGE